MMPEMDYAQLRERIKDCGYTQKKCAEEIGISESQLNRKLAVPPAQWLCAYNRFYPPKIWFAKSRRLQSSGPW